MTSRDDLPRLVVTGGFGRVASVVIPALRDAYRIHVVDRTRPESTVEPDLVTLGDLFDPQVTRGALRGADAVLHLAANASPASTWTVAMDNLSIVRHVLDAAAESEVSTVVLASSVHAAGGDFRAGAVPVRSDRAAHPCCAYGVAKAAMEAAAAFHHDVTGASVSSIRFGLTGWPLTNRQLADTWLGDDDAADLVRRALAAPPHLGVYHGVSRHGATLWAVDNALQDLGWAPHQDLPITLDELPPADVAYCRIFDATPPSKGAEVAGEDRKSRLDRRQP